MKCSLRQFPTLKYHCESIGVLISRHLNGSALYFTVGIRMCVGFIAWLYMQTSDISLAERAHIEMINEIF